VPATPDRSGLAGLSRFRAGRNNLVSFSPFGCSLMEVQKCERLRLINSVKARSTVNLFAWHPAASDTARSAACHKNAVKRRNHRIPAAAWGHDGNAAGPCSK
jgi:hypothetical protein